MYQASRNPLNLVQQWLVRITELSLNEKYNEIWEGKYLFDAYPFQNKLIQGDSSSSLFFKFALIR